MTHDEITRMAREAGFVWMDGLHKGLCRFAALVAAAEREACANVCDAQATEWDSGNVQLYKNYAGACSEAIRARGEKGQS